MVGKPFMANPVIQTHKYDDLSLERDCGTAPHPIYWKYIESLLIPIPQTCYFKKLGLILGFYLKLRQIH